MLFGLFKRKTEREKLLEQHKKLLEESFKLSKVNRRLSDEKATEADSLMKTIESMPEK